MENKVFFVKETSHGTLMFPPGKKKKHKRRPGDNLRTWQVKNDIKATNEVVVGMENLRSALGVLRPDVMADLERDIAEHGELWDELAKR